jgi:tetratricopeptide (TPR) repeat protein
MILHIRSFIVILTLLSFFLDGAGAISLPSVQFPKLSALDKRVDVPRASLDQGLYEQAVKEASGLIDSQTLDQPSLGYAYCLRGNARAILNQYAEAITDIETGLKQNPDAEGKAELYGIRANCMTALGKYSDAISSINESLASEPCGMAFYLRGNLNLRLKKYTAAVKDFEQAMQYSDCPEDTRQLKAQSITMLSAAKHQLINNLRTQKTR